MQRLLRTALDLELEVREDLLEADLSEIQPELVPIEALGIDEITITDFHEALQEEWNILIPESEMESWETASDVMDSITGRIPDAEP